MLNDVVLTALKSDQPLPPVIIAELYEGINKWDCEDWDAEIGQAILQRLQRQDEKLYPETMR